MSAVPLLPPEHHRAGPPRAPRKTVPAVALALAAPGEAAGLIDIYPPLPLANQPPYLLLAILLLAMIALIAVLVLLRRRRRLAPPTNADPAVAALAELHDAQQRLNDGGQARYAAYAEAVSGVLRRYCELRFHVSATRRTMKEFLGSLPPAIEPADRANTISKAPPANDYRDDVRHCLELCDLVKFAGLSPEPAGVDQLTLTVRSFIEATRNRSTTAEG